MANTGTLNLENITAENFEDLVIQLNDLISVLNKGNLLYKGDTGESPQIVQLPLVEITEDGVTYTDCAKQLIKYIFLKLEDENNTDPENVKVDEIIEASRDASSNLYGKLDFFWKTSNASEYPVMTYPWWCADGIEDYPIYPAIPFMYIDTGSKNVADYKDYSTVLTPVDIVYKEVDDENGWFPEVSYVTTSVYPSFYYDSTSLYGKGAWCWDINGVKTGIPASIANAEESSTKIFLLKEDGGSYEYFVSAKTETHDGSNIVYLADAKWLSYESLVKESSVRGPINNDIGLVVNSKGKTLEVRIYVESETGKEGYWSPAGGKGSNELITFDTEFVAFMWDEICKYSDIAIGKNFINLGPEGARYIIKNDEGELKIAGDITKGKVVTEYPIYEGGSESDDENDSEVNKLLTRKEVVDIVFRDGISNLTNISWDDFVTNYTEGTLMSNIPYHISYGAHVFTVNAIDSRHISSDIIITNKDKVYNAKLAVSDNNPVITDIVDEMGNMCNVDYLTSNVSSPFGEGCKNNTISCDSVDLSTISLGNNCKNNVIIGSKNIVLGLGSYDNIINSSNNIKIPANSYDMNITRCSNLAYINADSSGLRNSVYRDIISTPDNITYMSSNKCVNKDSTNTSYILSEQLTVSTPKTAASGSEVELTRFDAGDEAIVIAKTYSATGDHLNVYKESNTRYNVKNIKKTNLDPIWFSAYVDTKNPDNPVLKNATRREGVTASVTCDHSSQNYKNHNERQYIITFTSGNIDLSQVPVIVTLDYDGETEANCYITERTSKSIKVRSSYMHESAVGVREVYGMETWKGFNILIINNY